MGIVKGPDDCGAFQRQWSMITNTFKCLVWESNHHFVPVQVLSSSLEAHVLRSDNNKLARDCKKDMKSAIARLGKLGRKV